jgi:hypothetical protein
MQLNGFFKITQWNESIEKEYEDGSKITHATVSQEYEGDIIGSSSLQYQMYYKASGNALFVGFERITCTMENKPYQLILKHDGTFKNGVAASNFEVLQSDPLSSLSGLKGRFNSIEGGRAKYCIG